MFGYVRVNKPELKVKEYELYEATYCGLCRSMGKCTGQCSRMTLSYDFAFLALIRVNLAGARTHFGMKRCIAHPLKKKQYMVNNPSLEYCAGAAALLNYHKVADDLSDERGTKKLKARLAMPMVKRARKKALKKQNLSDLDGKIAEGLKRLSSLEAEKKASVNEPAEIFGRILGDIMSYGLEGADARVAYSLGLAVGKWIYIADALDDWEDDARKNRYNPFAILYEKDSPTESDLEGIKIALKNELLSAEAAMDLMKITSPTIESIISNILYLGLPERIEAIRFGDDKNKKDKKKRKHKASSEDLKGETNERSL
ncbi:MAG: hypothetical protein E7607_06180 [Ruminococcaceae bacterium]|nr:hypothetical protein [Oscillospiraceae bacterium]